LQAKIAFNIEVSWKRASNFVVQFSNIFLDFVYQKLNEKVMSSERVSLSQAEAVTLKSHSGAVRQTISIALTELMREA